jgi:hypothetical protein
MCEMYGHQWSSQQGDEPNDTWIRGLSGLTAEQYGHGLRKLFDRTDKWPPNLVEFRQLCTDYDPDSWRRQSHKTFESSSLIEDKTYAEKRKEKMQAEIQKMREAVGL